MSGMQVSNFHGVKIYNLSSGKTLPQWLSDKKRRSLSKDVEYRRRIELLQDFDFPTASQRVQVSADGQYVIVTGTYPPQVKVFSVADLAMKFERHLDCDAVDFLPLAEGYEKIAFLLADRTLEFHAGYGRHHTVRIPRFGRSLAYQQESCDMLVGGGGGEIHRFNLDLGRFRTPITLPSTRSCNGNPSAGINKIDLCVAHQLLAAGTDDGFLHLWDARQGQPGGGSGVAHLDLRDAVGAAAVSAADQTLDGFQVSAVAFDTDGLTLGVGTSSAHCLMFDLRSPRPSMVKEHQYGLPVTKVTFHQGPEKRVLSADRKTVKIWSRDDGAVLTNVETPADINDVCVAHDSRGDSGLLLMAVEQPRVLSYYVPALGPAPRWSSFLDGLTEELDEEGQASVYEDYKFVTSAEVEELGVSNLVGSALLRGYMHGYFMDMKLYARLKAVSEPFAYDEYRKKRLKQKIQEKQKSRIAIRSNLPKVNRAMAERLLQDKEGEGDKKRKRNKKGALGVQKDDDRDKDGMANASLSAENPLGDDRFAAMFESEAFQVDPESEEFARTHPTSGQARKVRERVESESESEDDVIRDRFTEVTGDSETARRRSFEDGDDDFGEDEDEEEQENADEAGRTNAASDVAAKGPASTKERRAGKGKKDKTPSTSTRGAAPVPVLYELNEGEDAASTAVGLGGGRDREAQRQKRRMRSKPLGERVQDAEKGDGTIVSERVIRTNAGVVREFSYTPASGGGRRGRGTRGGGGGRGRGRGRRR